MKFRNCGLSMHSAEVRGNVSAGQQANNPKALTRFQRGYYLGHLGEGDDSVHHKQSIWRQAASQENLCDEY
jgi:hypothetical protein